MAGWFVFLLKRDDEAYQIPCSAFQSPMNSIKHLSAETPVGAIQYSQALSAKQTDPEPAVSLVTAETFQIPLASFTGNARLESPCHGGRLPATESVMESFDIVREQLLRRAQTKTIAMEEGLQRSECSQRRFWGINE